MYLLVLVAFLHLDNPAEHIVLKAFKTLEACRIEEIQRNKSRPLEKPRQPGDVFVCVRVESET